MKRLKAFTVQELLIGIVLSSILIGAIYSFLTLYNKQFFDFFQKKEEIVELHLLRQFLAKDLSLCNQLELLNNKLVLTSQKGACVYVFSNKKIERKHNTSTISFLLKHKKPILEKRVLGNEVFLEFFLPIVLKEDSDVVIYYNKPVPVNIIINQLLFNGN